MLISVQIQMFDDIRVVEVAMSDRNDLYHLIVMMEANPNVKAWRIVHNAEIIVNPHLAFSFTKAVKMTKFTFNAFEM